MTESTEKREADEPNEFGFGGGATAPQPERESVTEGYGESIAVPAGDLTGSIVEAIEEVAEGHDDKDK